MATENFEKAGEIFQNAIEIEDPAERERYLDSVCKADQELRAEVGALLRAHEKAEGFLEAPGVESNVTLDGPAQIEGPGTRIGHYELLQLIGEGGMGLVYLAQQKEPVKRRVALKIIKPGMDSRQVIARFEAERQALALLDHPNIAHVFDAGTTEAGRPYFVMEYVKGMAITAYCDEYKLNIEQRLGLFEHVCEAIHHAHQKGIIHRDIKPSNILVSMHGDRAVPKIIDFGIAKATASSLTDKTVFTCQGQLLGTPEYMSPEQVDLATQDIDTRSDIYALGVVLYELLAGVLPFERESLARLGFAEVQRTIREQEPDSPSIRLTNLGQQAKTIATSRGTQAIALARRLHRELEWIPLRAMRKDRCRRYRSASEMADDVQNYLNGSPLIAGPETTMYRVRKFVHKHAGSVVTVALVALAIVLGLIVSTAMYFRAEDARQKEATARAEAEQATKKEAVARTEAEQAKHVAEMQKEIAELAREETEKRTEELRVTSYFNTISLASKELAEGGFYRTIHLLENCPRDLCGWEWHYLNEIANSIGILHPTSGSPLGPSSIGPNGRIALVGEPGTVIIIWDVETASEVAVLKGHSGRITSVALSADGAKIVSGSDDGIIKVWNTSTGYCIATITAYDESAQFDKDRRYIRSVALSPDGKRVISTHGSGETVMWDATSGEQVKRLVIKGISHFVYSPDGERILGSGTGIRWLAVLNADGTELPNISIRSLYPVCSADGQRIAYCTGESIGVCEAATGKKLNEFPVQFVPAAISLSPDNKYIVAGDWYGMVRVCEVASGTEVLAIRGHDERVRAVAFSRSVNRIISVDDNGTVGIWRFPRIGLGQAGIISSSLSEVAFSADRRQIAALSEDKLQILNASDGSEIKSFGPSAAFSYENTLYSFNGKHVVGGRRFISRSTGEESKVIKVWDCTTGKEVLNFESEETASVVAFSPDSKYVVSGCRSGLVMWDVAEGTKVKTFNLDQGPGEVTAIAIDPEGKRIVASSGRYSASNAITMWDIATAKEEWKTDTNQPIAVAAFSPDGKRVVSGDEEAGMVKIWNANTGENMTHYYHGGEIIGIAFSPDGRRILSGGPNGIIKIWDANTGAEVLTLDAQVEVMALSFSHDGKMILAGCDDGTIKVWSSGGLGGTENGKEPEKDARQTVR